MGGIVDLHGRTIGTSSNKGKITQAQAGAVILSEIDMAIQQWNAKSMETVNGDPKNAHLFKASFEKYAYAEEAAKASGHFGYAELKITVKHQDVTSTIYNKAIGFEKENQLDNTNGYYPNMVIDCLGFLIASGLLYNLALSQEKRKDVKKPKNAKLQSSSDKQDEPGTGDTGEAGTSSN